MKKLVLILLCLGLTGCGGWYKDYGLQKNQLLTHEALPQLIRALEDPNPKTRYNALRYIAKQRELAHPAIPAVVALAKTDKDEKTRACAIRVLAYIMQCTQANIDTVSNMLGGNLSLELTETIKQTRSRIIDKGVTGKKTPHLFENIELSKNITVELTPSFQFYNGYKNQYPSRSYKMIPIGFYARNDSDSTVRIDISSIKLFDAGKKPVARLPIEEVKNRFFYGAGYFAKSVLTGFPVVSQVKAGKANGQISKHCENTLLTDSEIVPESSQRGFLYFDCPDRPTNINGWQLNFSYTKGVTKHFVEYIFGGSAKITEAQKTMGTLPVSRDLPVTSENETLKKKLQQIKQLMDDRLITHEEYLNKRKILIEQF